MPDFEEVYPRSSSLAWKWVSLRLRLRGFSSPVFSLSNARLYHLTWILVQMMKSMFSTNSPWIVRFALSLPRTTMLAFFLLKIHSTRSYANLQRFPLWATIMSLTFPRRTRSKSLLRPQRSKLRSQRGTGQACLSLRKEVPINGRLHLWVVT